MVRRSRRRRASWPNGGIRATHGPGAKCQRRLVAGPSHSRGAGPRKLSAEGFERGKRHAHLLATVDKVLDSAADLYLTFDIGLKKLPTDWPGKSVRSGGRQMHLGVHSKRLPFWARLLHLLVL